MSPKWNETVNFLDMLNLDEMQVAASDLGTRLEAFCGDLYRRLRPGEPPPAFRVEFCRFAGVNNFIRRRNGQISLRISDVLQDAPSPVLESVAHILLAKLLREPVPRDHRTRYRHYLNREDVQRKMRVIRAERGRKNLTSARGRHYDLNLLFDQLNDRYFEGRIRRPVLGWSRGAPRRRLAHYDPAHHTIVVSRLLDNEAIPRFVIEYVLFHEALHIIHPARCTGTRRQVHTKEFAEAEKQFPRLAEAREWLRRL